MGRPAVFLDRDGTLNAQVVRGGKPFAPTRLEDFRILDGVPQACRRLKQAGYALIVATNQPDVGRGDVAQEVIESMHRILLEAIPEIDRIEACFDPGRGEPSRRRKPEPGMLLDAAAAIGIDLERSWMVGDRWKDVESGRRAGVRTILIDFGYDESGGLPPDHKVATFPEAADLIIGLTSRG